MVQRRFKLGLTGVLHTGGYTLHGEDNGIFKSRCVLALRIELNELSRGFARFHVVLRKVWPDFDVEARVTDLLERVGLAHVQCRDVWVT